MIRVSAPAKLNLFLHVTGRRSDGYHLLQSVFCLIDWQDTIELERRTDGAVERLGQFDWPASSDLTVRSANALKAWAHAQRMPHAQTLGCSIRTEKAIPAGAGLGGGSSDAASCLMGLRQLWSLPITDAELQAIGLQLGADVPFFLLGQTALAQGIGEALAPIEISASWFLVAVPPVHVSTASIFQSPRLDRQATACSAAQLQEASKEAVWTLGTNSLEPVASESFQAVEHLIAIIAQAAVAIGLPRAAARMSGSGGAIFCSCETEEQAQILAQATAQRAPTNTQIRVCRRLAQHPARALLQ